MEENSKYGTIGETIATALNVMDKLTYSISDAVIDVMGEKEIERVFLFDSCIDFYNENRRRIPAASGFILSVKKNITPRNNKDKYVITQGLIDEKDRPISLDGKTSVSRVIYATDVDDKTINYLNGEEVRIFTMN